MHNRKAKEFARENARLRSEYVAAEQELQSCDAGSVAARRLQRRMGRLADEFVNLNRVLAWEASKQFSGGVRPCDFDDVLAAALAALWDAFLSWDPAKGSFSTWSRLHRDGAAKRAAGKILFPELTYHDFMDRRDILAARESAPAGASTEEIAELAGVPVTVVERVHQAERSKVRVDQPAGDDDGASVGDLLAAPEVDPPSVDESELLIEPAVQTLSPLELWVFVRSHGLDGLPVQNGTDIARMLGYYRDAVGRVRNTAREKVTAVITGVDESDDDQLDADDVSIAADLFAFAGL